MMRFTRAIAAVALVLLMAGAASAAETTGERNVTESQLFSWARNAPPDWSTGVLLAAVGLAGALFTVFGLIGGAVPGTAGRPKIVADTARMERLSKRLEVLAAADPLDAKGIEALEKAVDDLRDDIRSERTRQFAIASTLYAVMGAFFAAMLAQDLLQAAVIGATWTGLAGSLGLKRDYAERKGPKDAALEKALTVAKSAEEAMGEPAAEMRGALDLRSAIQDLELDVRLAQQL